MYFISVKADDFDKYFINYIDGDILKSISSLSEVVNYSYLFQTLASQFKKLEAHLIHGVKYFPIFIDLI